MSTSEYRFKELVTTKPKLMSKLTIDHFQDFSIGEIGKGRTGFCLFVDSLEGVHIGEIFKTNVYLREEYKVTDLILGTINKIYCIRIDSKEGIDPKHFLKGTELQRLAVNVFMCDE
jgi:hypothetical protein